MTSTHPSPTPFATLAAEPSRPMRPCASPPRKRRFARESNPAADATKAELPACAPRSPSRLDQLEALLLRAEGATIADLVAATGWQQHSVRGALAGALKKRGLVISSDKVDGLRVYRAAVQAEL